MRNLILTMTLLLAVTVGGCSDDEEVVADPLGWWSTEVWGTGPNDVLSLGFDADRAAPFIQRGNLNGWTSTELDVSDLVAEYKEIFGQDREPLFELWAAGGPAGHVHLAGNLGVVYREAPGGWERVYSGLRLTDWRGVWATDEHVFVVGTFGKILRLEGDQYVLDEPVDHDLMAVWGSAPNNVWAVGNGTLHWNGTVWQTIDIGPELLYVTIDGRSASDIFVGGDAGVILHYDGMAWSEDYRHTRAGIADIQCFDDGTVVALAPREDGGTDFLERRDGSWHHSGQIAGVTLDA
ncbi:hypothetical protein DRQ50_12825, partial [bacterium]